MVQQQLGSAVASALKSGYDRTAIIRMVTSEIETQANHDLPHESAEVVYDVLPEGLIDLPSAAKRYGCATARLRTMVHRGKLTARGRLKAPAYGGGYVLLDESELAKVMANLPPKGRPKK